MSVSQQAKKFAFAIVAWCLAIGAFVFFRYAQTASSTQWGIGASELIGLSLYMGLIFGCLHWLSNWLVEVTAINRLPYIFSVIFKGLFLLLGATTLAYFTQYLNMSDLGEQFSTVRHMLTMHILYTPSFQALIVYLILVRISLAFIEQMSLLVGPRVLVNIGMGKYHKPRYEQRLFMFLDMASSTSHAENLGDYRFSRLIQDSFSLLADTVTKNEAEIYRYMGDAVLLHWPLEQGVQQDRCLNIYFEFIEQLQQQAEYFEQQYGFVPQFKAAAHCGQVVAAVVGVNKQEISFFSDVINTLARLQDQCNPLGEKILLSGHLVNLLEQPDPKYQLKDLGLIQLKGKQQLTQVYSVKLMTDARG